MELSRSASLDSVPVGYNNPLNNEALNRAGKPMVRFSTPLHSPNLSSSIEGGAHSRRVRRLGSFTTFVRAVSAFLSRSRSNSPALSISKDNPTDEIIASFNKTIQYGPKTIQEMVDERFEKVLRERNDYDLNDREEEEYLDEHLANLLKWLCQYYYEELKSGANLVMVEM